MAQAHLQNHRPRHAQVHNELGPGHRERVYHDAMAVKLKEAGLNFEDEPYISVTLDDGTVVGGSNCSGVAATAANEHLRLRAVQVFAA